MKVNVDKMHNQLARSTPDVTTRTFNFIEDPQIIDEWRERWAHLMRVKHGVNLASINAWQDELSAFNTRTITFEAVLHDTSRRGRRLKRITLHPPKQEMTKDEFEDSMGLRR